MKNFKGFIIPKYNKKWLRHHVPLLDSNNYCGAVPATACNTIFCDKCLFNYNDIFKEWLNMKKRKKKFKRILHGKNL